MLTKIRERATGWIAWVIVILITIPFALWGIQSYFENASQVPVATVNGDEITSNDFQNELSRQRQALARQLGSSFDPAILESAGMRQQVVESMIGSRLMNQYVRDQNYRISDEQLKERIESNAAFLSDGQFNPDLYRDLLRSNGFSPQTFEATERQSAAISQLASAVSDSSFVTEQELNQLLSLQAQKRQTDYVILPANRFESEFEIDEAEARQEYDDNLSIYEAPSRIKVDYIELSVDELMSRIEPSEEEVRQTFDQTSGRYKQAEARKASHILLSVKSSASDSERDEILARAESLLIEAQSGADFSELARLHSDDPGSKNKGGDLGVVTRGQMVKPFEDVVFDMTQDEIRGPIKTRFGYHIIKLTELSGERKRSFDEVRDQVAEETKRAQAENLFAEFGESFQNLVFEDPESLISTADELDLEIRQTDWFTGAAGAGLASEPKIRRAAFSEDVLNDDLNSSAIELGFDRLVAIRKAEYEPAQPRPFEEVRSGIEQKLKRQKSIDRLIGHGEQLVATLENQDDWNNLLSLENLESSALAEQRNEVPANLAELADVVFSRALPESGSADYGGIELNNGDYAIFALKEVIQGELEAIDDAERTRLKQQLLAREGSQMYQQFRQSMREAAKVEVDEGQLVNSITNFQ